MSTVRVIIEMGAGVSLAPGGRVNLSGLKKLTPYKLQIVLALVGKRKAEIVKELSEALESSGLKYIPSRPPDASDLFWQWHSALELRSVAIKELLKIRRSVHVLNSVQY